MALTGDDFLTARVMARRVAEETFPRSRADIAELETQIAAEAVGLWSAMAPGDHAELLGTAMAIAKARWGELEADAVRADQPIVLARKIAVVRGGRREFTAVVVREGDHEVPADRRAARVALEAIFEAMCQAAAKGVA